MKTTSNIVCVLALLLLTVSPALSQDKPLDGAGVLEGLSASENDVAHLENGGVITFDSEPYEMSKRELAADAAILVERDLSEILKQFHEHESLLPVKDMLGHKEIYSEKDIAAAGYNESEIEEVDNLLGTKPGKKFNFSEDEYILLSVARKASAGGNVEVRVAAANEFIREVLVQRYREYISNGMAGIHGYKRSSRKTVDIGAELRLTNEAFAPFEPDYPDFYKGLVSYPEGADCCKHEFRWLKAKLRKRPAFILAHTMYQHTEHHLLITERFFYVNNTANSAQITMAWMHYKDDTYLGLSMSASADILDSLLGKMLRPLGRNKAEEMVTEVLTGFRESLLESDESAETPD